MGFSVRHYLSSAELAAVCALLGKIPTFAEYMKYMGEISSKGAEIYRYLNFNQVAEYQQVADTVKLAA